MVVASSYDHKCPLRTFVSKANVTFAKPLRLKVLQSVLLGNSCSAIMLCRTLHGANLGLFLVTHSLAYKYKELFKTVNDLYLFTINIYMYEGNENYAKFCRFSKMKIGCPFEGLYLGKTDTTLY